MATGWGRLLCGQEYRKMMWGCQGKQATDSSLLRLFPISAGSSADSGVIYYLWTSLSASEKKYQYGLVTSLKLTMGPMYDSFFQAD
jgi:hypothetical protein